MLCAFPTFPYFFYYKSLWWPKENNKTKLRPLFSFSFPLGLKTASVPYALNSAGHSVHSVYKITKTPECAVRDTNI